MKMKKEYISRFILAVAGVVLIGIGVAFNAAAALGNDSVGIVYDGIRSALGLTAQQLGNASDVVNIVLIVLIFITGRRYINVGTFVYMIPYGTIVNFGGKLYHKIFLVQTMQVQILGSVIGCSLLYLGVAMYITADIGLDPFTGIVMVIRDRVKKNYRTVKVTFDACCIVVGTLLGGKLGVITVVTVLTAGPVIQFLSERIEKLRRTNGT